MKVKLFKHNDVVTPMPGTEHSVAVDLVAHLPYGFDTIKISYDCHPHMDTKDIVINQGGRVLIPTGIHIRVPDGYEVVIRPRSGLAISHGVTVLNAPGTIDQDFIGEIGVILINASYDPYIVKNGDRIAQLALRKAETIEWDEYASINVLGETDRGEGGFGSTGK